MYYFDVFSEILPSRDGLVMYYTISGSEDTLVMQSVREPAKFVGRQFPYLQIRPS